MRKRFRRRLHRNYDTYYYKPRGVPLSDLEEILLTDEELETMNLRYNKNMSQEEAAKSMNISQSQYQRDLHNALKKVTNAITNGNAIRIGLTD